jgi:hypothetical protein
VGLTAGRRPAEENPSHFGSVQRSPVNGRRTASVPGGQVANRLR